MFFEFLERYVGNYGDLPAGALLSALQPTEDGGAMVDAAYQMWEEVYEELKPHLKRD